MKISHTYKFVYVAYPKCGSTTLSCMLGGYAEPGTSMKLDNGEICSQHATTAELRRGFHINGWDPAEYVWFTTVRNPWAKIVSLFNYERPDSQMRSIWSPDYFPIKPAGFMEWAELTLEGFSKFHTLEYFAFEDGELAVDKIVLLENFDYDLKPLFASFGVGYQKAHSNKSPYYQPYQQWYTPQLRKRVEELFAFDIEVGGYTFEGGHRKPRHVR